MYEIDCEYCERKYIGETKKRLEERVKEHICNIRTKREISLIFQHCRDNNHSIKFNNAKVIASNKNPTARRFLESFYSKNQNSFNRYIECLKIYDSIVNNAINNWWNVFLWYVGMYRISGSYPAIRPIFPYPAIRYPVCYSIIRYPAGYRIIALLAATSSSRNCYSLEGSWWCCL